MNQVAMVVGQEIMQGISIIDSHLPRLPLMNVQLPATDPGREVDILGPFFFFLRFYLFSHERHTERGRDIGRGRSRLPAGSPMRDLIPGL